MKLAIVGSRKFNDYDYLKQCILERYRPEDIDLIVSGGCYGTDYLAEKFAKEFEIDTLIYRAKWKKKGKAAGILRNKIIVDACDKIIIFWDLESRGTRSVVEYAHNKKQASIISVSGLINE